MADTTNNALLDIANNGAALNQALSELSTNVAKLSSITLPVANGGTGQTSLTVHNVLLGNGTSPVQSVAPGTNGNVLTSNGTTWVSSALPTPAANVSSISFGSTGLTPSTPTTGAVSVAGTLGVGNGGTGRATLTQYALLAGGTTTTGAVQSVGTGSSNQVLTSQGASAVPVFQTLTQEQLSSAFNATGSAPFYACRAWVNFDATRDAAGNSNTSNTNRYIRASGNVSSVLKTATGIFTITFTTAMPDANGIISGFCSFTNTSVAGLLSYGSDWTGVGTTSVDIKTANSTTAGLINPPFIMVAVFR